MRKAGKADEAAIRELFIEMLQTIYAREDVDGYEDGYLDKFFGGGEDWVCVAEADGRIMAYLSVEVHREEGDFLYLDDLSVSAQYRGNGIGTELIRAAERFAEEMGIPTVVFHVEKSNQRAFALYGRLGYSVLSDEGTRFRMVKHLA